MAYDNFEYLMRFIERKVVKYVLVGLVSLCVGLRFVDLLFCSFVRVSGVLAHTGGVKGCCCMLLGVECVVVVEMCFVKAGVVGFKGNV